MDIRVKDENASLKYIEHEKFLWTLYQKKFYRTFIIHISIAILLAVVGLLDLNKQLENHYLGISGEKPITQLPFLLILGILYLFFSLSSLSRLAIEKSKSIKKLYQNTIRQFGISNISLLLINETSITFETPLIKKEIKWNLITNYAEVENKIILIPENTLGYSIVVDKNRLTEEELSSFRNFLRIHIPVPKSLLKS